MSMENAILEHAAALRELSAAIKAMYAGRADALALSVDGGEQSDKVAGALRIIAGASPAEILTAATPAKGSTKKSEPKADAELEQSVQKVESDAAAEKARIDADTKAAEANRTEVHLGDDVAPELDYAKDVRPVLLAAIKKGKRAEIEAHLAAAGVAKADQLKPEQLPAVLKLATQLAA